MASGAISTRGRRCGARRGSATTTRATCTTKRWRKSWSTRRSCALRTRWGKTAAAASGGVGGPKGEDIVITEYLNRGKHISVLALYGYKGFMAFDWKEGGYDGDAFLSAMEFTICPHLQRYVKGDPRPNSIFVLDNCPAHKKHEAALRALVEGKCGAKPIFLAPYSPIDNPIEMAFNCFKACWRRHGMWLTALPMHTRIRWCLANCYEDATAAAPRTYAACGYRQIL